MLLTWKEYTEWEKDPNEIARVQERNAQAQAKIDGMVNFEEKFQSAYIELDTNSNIEPMIKLLSNELQEIAGENFNYIMLYFERILSEYTLNRDLWALFVNYTDEMCKAKDQRL
jgi:hypothetical protein